MDDLSFTNGLININIEAIKEAIIEVFGEKYRDKISERVNNITFYYNTSNDQVIDYLNMALNTLDSDVFSEVSFAELATRRANLNQMMKYVESKQLQLEEIVDSSTSQLKELEERCMEGLSDYEISAIGEDLKYFIFDNRTGEISDYYFKKFAPFFGNPTSIEELKQNLRFQKVLVFLDKAISINANYINEEEKHTPTKMASMQEIKNANILDSQTEDEIKSKYFDPLSFLTKSAFIVYPIGVDGKRKSLIGLNLNHKTRDLDVIHEMIHAVCFFETKDGVVSGFYSSNGADYTGINEICTEWLALKVYEKFLEKNSPMVNSTIINQGYDKYIQNARNFLIENQSKIITAFMSDNPMSFREEIGEENFDEINSILEKLLGKENISKQEQEFLDRDFVAE